MLKVLAALGWLTFGTFAEGSRSVRSPCRIVASRAATMARWLSSRWRRFRFLEMTKERIAVDRRHEAREVFGAVGPVVVIDQAGFEAGAVAVAAVENRPIPYDDLVAEIVRLHVGDELRELRPLDQGEQIGVWVERQHQFSDLPNTAGQPVRLAMSMHDLLEHRLAHMLGPMQLDAERQRAFVHLPAQEGEHSVSASPK
jgi:hypothetical protein